VKKRSKEYLAKKAAKHRASIESRQQSHQKAKSTPPKRWRFLKTLEWMLGTPLALLGAVYAFWGPPWPTEPKFALTFPSSSFALDVPFNITNASALFSLRDLQIFCAIISIDTTAAIKHVAGLSVTTGRHSTLGPLATASYTCPFSEVIRLPPDTKITGGSIQFWTEYESRLPWRDRTRSMDESFTLNTKTNPPQWTEGNPLQ
jgi:hypothetical protein